MKFLYLRLENFLSYKDLEFDLTNVNYAAVTGPNGSGKSTIPAAIAWALYGTLRVDGDRDSVVNDEADSAQVNLDIEDNDGQVWQIARRRDYNGSGFVRIFRWDADKEDWIKHGDHLSKTHEEQIRAICGMSENAFYSLVMVDQSSTAGGTRFTSSDSNTRRSILHGLVPELALWSDYHAVASDQLSDAKRELGTVEQDIATTDRHITEEGERLADLTEQIGSETQRDIDDLSKDLGKRIASLTKKIGAAGEGLTDEIEARIRAAKSDHELALERIRTEIRREEDDLDKRDRLVRDIRRLDKQLDDWEAEADRLTDERKGFKLKLKAAVAALPQLEDAAERLERKKETLEGEVSKSSSRLTQIREQLSGLEIAAERGDGECPTCGSALSADKCDHLIEALTAERTNVTRDLDDDKDALSNVRRKLSDNQTLISDGKSDIREAESHITSLKTRIDKLYDDIEEREPEIDDLKDELAKFRKASVIEDSIADLKEQLSNSRETFEKKVISVLEKELDAARSDSVVDKLKDDLDKLKDEQDEVSRRSQRFSRLSGSLDTTREAVKRLNDERDELVKRQATLHEDIDELSWLDRALSQKGIPSMLLDSVLASIEQEQNAILEQLSDSDQMRVEFRQTRELKSRNGSKDVLDIVVHTPGGRERQIESFSFGERVRLSISNVFAMIKVFNERSGGLATTLFLDEPLGPLDEKSVPAFIEVLRVAMNTGIVESIWVITHDRTVIDALPQEVKVINTPNGSEVTVV